MRPFPLVFAALLALGGCQRTNADPPKAPPSTEAAEAHGAGALLRNARAGVVEFFPDESSPNTGSGFIVAADGLVVTNRHVAKDCQRCTVRVWNRERRPVRLVGVDEERDIAVVAIDPAGDDFPRLALADRPAATDDTVLSLGFPNGNGIAFVAGRVLGTSESVTTNRGEQFDEMLRTSRSLDHGSSGGPVLDLSGRVVGMNTLVSPSDGHAVPVDFIRAAVLSARRFGRIVHGRIGAYTERIAPDGAHPHERTRLTHVISGSAADEAGLFVADYIVAVDGKAVTSERDYVTTVHKRLPGERVALTIERAGETMRIDVTLSDTMEKAWVEPAPATSPAGPPFKP